MSGSSSRSQVFDLIFGLLGLHGFSTNEAQASIFGVSATTISNWKSGKVKTLNRGKLEEVIARIHFLSKRRGVDLVGEPSLCPIVIEEGAGPEDLERELRDKWDSVYLGHKFLYYHPAGAMAWTKLLATGYGNALLLKGFVAALERALAHGRGSGETGKLAAALRWHEGRSSGIDLISLGPGDGTKEAAAIGALIAHAGADHRSIDWLTYTPVDVSIPLLRHSSEKARNLIRDRVARERWPHFLVRPSCSDFEDGNVGFASHLSEDGEDRRIVLFLGGTFGNLKSETAFVEHTLEQLMRPGDLLWLEVGARQSSIQDDPLYALSEAADAEPDTQETVRRALVEGPHRRFCASVGAPFSTNMRIIARDGGATCEVPRSYNFVHDVEINRSGQRCSVLYSRRYELQRLREWFASFGYETLFEYAVKDRQQRDRTVHLLLRRARA